MGDLKPGTDALLTGRVYEYFDLAAAEEELGIDLKDSVYEEWDSEPYLLATVVRAASESAP